MAIAALERAPREAAARPAETPLVHGCDTVARLFWNRVAALGPKVALREKVLGVWRSTTWTQYGERAMWTGLGLVSLGLERGDVVSVISENLPEWLYTDLGTLGAGGVTNGIYTTDAAKQVEYILADSGSKFVCVENEEQLDKVLEVRARCRSLQKIFVYDLEGLRDFSDEQVMPFAELMELGRRFAQQNPEFWRKSLALGRPQDLAALIYTSGTTGPPKGAMISNANVLFQLATLRHYVDFDEEEDQQQLSFLPLCHVAERNVTTYWPLQSGATVNFAESIETVAEDIREVQPTVFLAVPRIWEKFYSGIVIQMKEATRLGQLAYGIALKIGYQVAECRLAQREPSPPLRAAFFLADQLVLGNIKRALGLARATRLISGAAPVSPDLLKWYMALGLDMREVYGQTESSGAVTAMPPERVKLGTVGKAVPGVEIRLSPQMEILVRGPAVFSGYLNNPQKTAETIVDGWLHTGDVGVIDDEGFVKITDRMKDIIITAGGKNVTPSEIENQLKFSPFISDAVVIGDKRKFLACLVMIDHDNVVKFAQDHDVPFTNFASLCRATQVQELIWDEIEKVNRNLARVETIKRFRLIDQLLTAEDDELTPTMKLKRKFVNEKYKDLIDGMYAEG
jgi:long-chain acyl-CoA synthetase